MIVTYLILNPPNLWYFINPKLANLIQNDKGFLLQKMD